MPSKGQLFLGNGEVSKREVQELHIMLDRAVQILGGLQQPMDPTIERSPEQLAEFDRQRDEDEAEVSNLAKTIYLSLVGGVGFIL